ncbi:MAG TPA: GNAT family N-acetyltransferase [Thermoanaerobaculia bacterium]|nr:GNAT family N-acetyltransferase [Thermoanaerobaculia bacterium]
MTSGFDARLPAAEIRPVRPRDRAAIEDFLRASENFTAEEVGTALELIDEALAGDDEYIVNVLSADGRVVGYECHGPASLTVGTYDLYWIAVDPRAQRQGYGRRLLRAAEEDVARRAGRLLLIETSSKPSYAPTVEFYKRNGYHLDARIRDYYRLGDDKLVFAKEIRNDAYNAHPASDRSN